MKIGERLILLVADLDWAAVICADFHGLDFYVCPCGAVKQKHSLGSPHTKVALWMANEHQVRKENGANQAAGTWWVR